MLSDYQITVPELGTFTAARPPIVVLTSNRTRDVHDALKRRCLYHWVEHPELRARGRDRAPARARRASSRWPARSPQRSRRSAASTCTSRRASPRPSTGRRRSPCSASTQLDERSVDATLGTVLKYREDQERVAPARPRRHRQAGVRARHATALTPPDTGDRRRERIAVAFARVLRGAGLDVPIGSVLDLRRGARPRRHRRPRHRVLGGRATLVRRPEDIAALRPRLRRVLGARQAADRARRASRRCIESRWPSTTTTTSDDGDDDDGERRRRPDDRRCASAPPRCCATRTSPPTTTTSCAEAQRLMAAPAPRRPAAPVAARWRRRAATRPRPTCAAPCAPRCAPAASRSAGAGASRATGLRRLVLLLDVSGSMEPYARAMLRFVHAAVAGRQRVEAFALGTRLTRVTRELGGRDPDARAAPGRRAGADWSGGTRLGECLRTFNDEWGVRGMARGAIVVDPQRRLGPRRPGGARRADGAPAARRPRADLGQPAEGHARATRRWPVGWPPPCRMLTTSWKAIRWPRWKSWPR